MVDFNTKKNILKKLRKARSENKLLWLPCVIAAAFVKLWYGTVCRIGMALSDRNGNFLGIKMPERQPKSRRKDDIVYVKKPFIGRFLSAVLAAAFMLMVAPELNIDLGVRASALTYKGKEYTPCTSESTPEVKVYYQTDAFNYAVRAGVTQASDPKYLVSNSAVKVFWNAFDQTLIPEGLREDISFQGYEIRVYLKGGGDPVHTGIATKDSTEFEFSRSVYSNISEIEYSVAIVPKFKIRLYSLAGTAIDPGTGEIVEGSTAELDPYPTITYDVSSNNDTCKYDNIGPLNAKLAMPELQQIADSLSNSVTLKWSPVQQIGGNPDPTNRYADGYVIYRKNASVNNSSYTKIGEYKVTPDSIGSDGYISFADRNNIQYGAHYEYFVEAYKIIWDVPGSSEKNYNVNNYGMITSSGTSVRESADQKASTIYSDKIKDAYIVPAKPSLVVSVSKTNIANHEIALSWADSSKIYDGVQIFRTNREIKNIPEIDDGTVSLTDWIIDHYESNTGGEYGLTRVCAHDSHTTSDTDTNVAEGVQYYYYAIAYITKENGMPLYGSPTTALGKLELDLGKTTLRVTKGDGRVDLSWDKVDGADGYEIEIIKKSEYNKETGKCDPLNPPVVLRQNYDIGNVTSYPHVYLYNGEQYTYRVRPYVWIETSSGTRPFYGNNGDGYCEARTVTVGLGLDTPVITEADGKKDGQVTIKWDKVDGATYYILYYRNTSADDFDEANTEYKHVQTTKTTYTQTNLHNDDVYEYYVVAYKTVNSDGSDGAQIIDSEPSEHATVKVGTALNTPQNIKAVTADGQITVSWDNINGAEGYLLYYKYTDKKGVTYDYNEDRVFDVKKSPYIHSGLQNGDRYTYKVIAYKEPNGKRVFSPMSNEVWAIVGVPLDAPKDFSGTTTDGIVNLKWSPVKGAEGYILHVRKNGGAWEDFDISKPSFQHTGLNNGDRYEYYVEAYKTVNGERITSSGESNHLNFTVGTDMAAPKDFTATESGNGQVTLKWTAVKGAEGYIVYAYCGGRSYQFNTSRPTYIHTGLLNGESWTYYVVAYKNVNGEPFYSNPSESKTVTINGKLDSPKDFTVTKGDGKADLKWTAVKGAEGYVIHASSGGRYYQFDVSKTTYTHSDLTNGDVWTYYVTAYKTVSGSRVYSDPSESKTVNIGISLNSAVDLTATAGNRQIDLKWTAVKGAEGYVVYLYNSKTMEFEPITVTSKTNYSHVGLKNGKQYTYMVAPYKTINGKRFYGDYSLSITAIPTTGSITDMDHELNVKGTAPYGISHSEYISAVSNHGAFDESVDVYFTTNRKSTQAVKDVLKNYANGLSSFIIYPFDISIYRENTHIEVDPADGYTVTVTMPVPDRLIAYRDYITVVHIGDGDYETEEMSFAEDWLDNYDRRLEVLPCAIVDIDNVWCVQFKCSSFSPYALVIYKEHIQDVASGGGLLDDGFTDTFNSGLLLFTALPDIMPHNRKLRIVQSGSKRYRIKSVTKK